VNYEGQAAIELENLCDVNEHRRYTFEIDSGIVRLSGFFRQVVFDVLNRIPPSVISAKFHNGLAELFSDLCNQISSETGIHTVALSGGVWQNKTLLEKTSGLLKSNGYTVLVHHQVPTNDGGIALGQVAIAATLLNKE